MASYHWEYSPNIFRQTQAVHGLLLWGPRHASRHQLLRCHSTSSLEIQPMKKKKCRSHPKNPKRGLENIGKWLRTIWELFKTQEFFGPLQSRSEYVVKAVRFHDLPTSWCLGNKQLLDTVSMFAQPCPVKQSRFWTSLFISSLWASLEALQRAVNVLSPAVVVQSHDTSVAIDRTW